METTYAFETEEHGHLRREVTRWAAREIAPHARQWEEAGIFPRGLYDSAAAAGLLGVGYPEAVGGAGGDVSHLVVAADAMIVAGQSVGTVAGLGSHAIALPPILRAGTAAQQQRFIPPVLRGERIAALAITEPSGGSDVASLQTRAVRDGDHYVVTGAKTFITSGTRADLFTVAVRTGDPGHGGVSLLVVPADTPGFSVGRKLEKMGWWASDTAEIHFDACRVPVDNLLGPEGAGFVVIAQNFAVERVLLAAQCVAIATLALQASIDYVRERRAFGKPLVGFQVLRHKLADMTTRLAAARALTGEVVTRLQRGEDMQLAGLAAMAKNTATDMCSFVCDEAVQLHGGYGYMREQLVERLYRDARLYPIGGGTREIMNEIICKTEGF
jgi:acyl-CoA dehydrogenase